MIATELEFWDAYPAWFTVCFLVAAAGLVLAWSTAFRRTGAKMWIPVTSLMASVAAIVVFVTCWVTMPVRSGTPEAAERRTSTGWKPVQADVEAKLRETGVPLVSGPDSMGRVSAVGQLCNVYVEDPTWRGATFRTTCDKSMTPSRYVLVDGDHVERQGLVKDGPESKPGLLDWSAVDQRTFPAVEKDDESRRWECTRVRHDGADKSWCVPA